MKPLLSGKPDLPTDHRRQFVDRRTIADLSEHGAYIGNAPAASAGAAAR